MKILNIKILSGPNYWSNYRKNLIVLKVDLEALENYSTKQIPGFNDKLINLIPTLYEHQCSEKQPGGFIKRLEEGIWLGHVIEHVALEMQCLAGMHCGYGRTRSTRKVGVYNIVFSYEFEDAGIYVANAAFKLVNTLVNEGNYLTLNEDLDQLKKICKREKLGPSTSALVNELKQRKIPYTRLNKNSLIRAGHGKYQKLILATETSFTSVVGVDIARDKELTKKLLTENFFKVPKGFTIRHGEELREVVDKLKYPLVIKPKDTNHGRGVTTRITNYPQALNAFNQAKEYTRDVIIEEFIEGFDYRVLVVNHKVVAASKREPAKIIGDGNSTIQELIELTNQDNNRGEGHENILTAIVVDESTNRLLNEKNYSLSSVLAKDEKFYLKDVANLSSGGTSEDVTDSVHPYNKEMIERISRLMGLDVCGVDLISKNISIPITENQGAIIEVNSAPGFRMHLHPTKGKKINVAQPVIEMLFPKNMPNTIPIVAVTGTNGKTTIVRLIAYLAHIFGHTVGMTTTEGIYINNHEIYRGDCSGPLSAKTILSDSSVDFAVLECARGGILRGGLGFDECDISILSNIAEDHLGLHDIDTLEDLARVKSVVPYSTKKSGVSILNADDDLVYQIKDELVCKVALFALNKSKRIEDHLANGGLVSYLKNDEIFIQEGEKIFSYGKLESYPITINKSFKANIKNLLPACLASYVLNFNGAVVIEALRNLELSCDTLPGRMTSFEFDNTTVILDYAHNPAAFLEIKDFVMSVRADKKIGIIGATGDRREIDIINLGRSAGETFDEIIIRHDKDGRGRTNDELTKLLMEGINQSHYSERVSIISDECKALHFAMQQARGRTLIMYFPDDVHEAITFLKDLATKTNQVKEVDYAS